jgi:hypothetical protein
LLRKYLYSLSKAPKSPPSEEFRRRLFTAWIHYSSDT